MWKKEVSFSRKAVNDEPEKTEPVVSEETADPVVPVATESEAAPEETVWKKEVSFSRKPEVEACRGARDRSARCRRGAVTYRQPRLAGKEEVSF